MAIYMPKHEMIEARQFTGGVDNALDLISWMSTHNGKAVHAFDGDNFKNNRIMVETSKYEYEPAFISDWILIHQDDRIEVIKHPVFRDRYAKVGPN